MLYLETVESRTIALLKELQSIEELQDFPLVGGTALALYYGHRQSIDIDLFGPALNKTEVVKSLKAKFKRQLEFVESKVNWSLFCFIDGIKVDIIQYPHPILSPLIVDSELILYSIEDLAAMKVNAALNRGTKKDFWDIYELLQHLSLKEIISFFEKKYQEQRQLISIPQALVYFEDAENVPDPICLKNRSWDDIKNGIRQIVSDYLS
ncbi:MAG: nucleotidyl transferase AbiEii/AbiGii toxin family protein [Cytophagales bacterium]|nr:nucleotidyl transferase AbiEii/AbiGii toxin family protein [Cytophagales bacterium]